MPTYRLVASLRPGYVAEGRGDPQTQMTHWVQCADNADAIECAHRLGDHIASFGAEPNISPYWTCYRGSQKVHKVVAELWDDDHRLTTVGGYKFSLYEFPEISGGLPDLPGLSLTGKPVHTMASPARACMVEITANNGHKRRTYVGPISPVAVIGSISVPLLGELIGVMTGVGGLGLPFPIIGVPELGLPGNDYDAGEWPEEFAQLVAQWVDNIPALLSGAGASVVRSLDTLSPAESARASTTVAQVGTRMLRGRWVDA